MTTIADAEDLCFHKARLSSACVLSMIWARLRLSLLLFRRERAVFLLLHLCRPRWSVETSGLGGTASSLGKQFTEGFDSGISKKAVDMDGWKEKTSERRSMPSFRLHPVTESKSLRAMPKVRILRRRAPIHFKNKGENTLSIGG